MYEFKQLVTLVACTAMCTVILFLQTPISSCSAQISNTKQSAQTRADLFALIATLEKSLPFRSKNIEKLIGRPFAVDPSESDQYEACSTTKRDSTQLVSEVLVREPVKLSEDRGGLIELEINSKVLRITQGDIVSQFGKESSILKQPLLAAPSEVKFLDYRYERAWGTLTFQIPNKAPYCLTGVSLSSYSPPNAI